MLYCQIVLNINEKAAINRNTYTHTHIYIYMCIYIYIYIYISLPFISLFLTLSQYICIYIYWKWYYSIQNILSKSFIDVILIYIFIYQITRQLYKMNMKISDVQHWIYEMYIFVMNTFYKTENRSNICSHLIFHENNIIVQLISEAERSIKTEWLLNLSETGWQIHLPRKQCLINRKSHRHAANEVMDSYR